MSPLFQLNLRDILKGLIVACSSAVLAAVYNFLTVQGYQIDAIGLLKVAAAAGVGYLIKNLFQDEQGKIGGKL